MIPLSYLFQAIFGKNTAGTNLDTMSSVCYIGVEYENWGMDGLFSMLR